jgi:hypothetical protein
VQESKDFSAVKLCCAIENSQMAEAKEETDFRIRGNASRPPRAATFTGQSAIKCQRRYDATFSRRPRARYIQAVFFAGGQNWGTALFFQLSQMSTRQVWLMCWRSFTKKSCRRAKLFGGLELLDQEVTIFKEIGGHSRISICKAHWRRLRNRRSESG